MTDYALPSLLDKLSPESRTMLQSLGRRENYSDGAVIHRRGDSDVALGIVIRGAIKMLRYSSHGLPVLTMTVGVGHHFADTALMINSPRTHDAVAVGNVVVDYYPPEVFAHLLDNAEILKALYMINTSRLNTAIEMFDDVRILRPEIRLAKMLSAIRSSMNGSSQLAVNQDELASLLGVSAMTLSKALKELKVHNLIETGYRSISILDHARFDDWLRSQTEV